MGFLTIIFNTCPGKTSRENINKNIFYFRRLDLPNRPSVPNLSYQPSQPKTASPNGGNTTGKYSDILFLAGKSSSAWLSAGRRGQKLISLWYDYDMKFCCKMSFKSIAIRGDRSSQRLTKCCTKPFYRQQPCLRQFKLAKSTMDT